MVKTNVETNPPVLKSRVGPAQKKKKMLDLISKIGSAFSIRIFRSSAFCYNCGKITPYKARMVLLEDVLADLLFAPKIPMVECEDCLDESIVKVAMEEKVAMGLKKSQLN